MKEFELYKKQAIEAGCEKEILALENIADNIYSGGSLNVAVLGEVNSGKTILVNRLAGIMVREPSVLPDSGLPLCVTFGHDNGRQGYECIRTDAPGRTGLTLLEMPIDVAISRESGKPMADLESCDLVIYIVNALAALTARDLQNLASFTNRIPCVLAINRLSGVEDPEEREEILDFIRRKYEKDFGEAITMNMEQESEALFAKWQTINTKLSVQELRDFHITGLHELVKGILRKAYEDKLVELKNQRKLLEEKEKYSQKENTQRSIEWAKLRNEFMEKRQMVQGQISRMIEEERNKTESALLLSREATKFNTEWLKKADKQADQLYHDSVERLGTVVKNLGENHYTWLLTEVKLRFGKELNAEDWTKVINRMGLVYQNIFSDKNQTGISPTTVGAVALGALAATLLYNPLLGLPVGALGIAVFTWSSHKENSRISEEKALIANWCYTQYRDLDAIIFETVNVAYEQALTALQTLADEKNEATTDFEELDKKERILKEKLCDTVHNN